MIKLSIVICTYNRAALVGGTINCLLSQAADKPSVEIIVVDNNSRDGTKEAVEGFVSRSRNMRYVFEGEQGLSYAKNRGFREAKGEYVGYIDDDILLPDCWIDIALKTMDAHNPDAFGGPIFACYLKKPPAWFDSTRNDISWGEKERYFEKGERFYGCNVVFKKSLLQDIGGFRADAGVSGRYFSSNENEDVLIFDDIWRKYPGAKVYYSPSMYVRHLLFENIADPILNMRFLFSRGLNSANRKLNGGAPGRGAIFLRELEAIFANAAAALLQLHRQSSLDAWLWRWGGGVAYHAGRLLGAIGVKIRMKRRN